MRKRPAFTMIELLIVIIILGILAAIAAPRFVSTRRKAFIASMIADLRTTVSAAEAYYSQTGTYVNYPAPRGSNGASITFTGTANGWRATATHPVAPGLVCVVERGPAATVIVPTCN